MIEKDLVLIIFFFIGLYLLVVGKFQAAISVGPTGIDSHVKKDSKETPIKAEGIAVRITGISICSITVWMYFN